MVAWLGVFLLSPRGTRLPPPDCRSIEIPRVAVSVAVSDSSLGLVQQNNALMFFVSTVKICTTLDNLAGVR